MIKITDIIVLTFLLLGNAWSIRCQSDKHYFFASDFLMDRSLPLQLTIEKSGEDCTGQLSLINEGVEISLEGECTDTSYLLFEIDSFSRVSGVLQGSSIQKGGLHRWSNFNHSLSYSLSPVDHTGMKMLSIYHERISNDRGQVIICAGDRRVSFQNNSVYNLTWDEFTCPESLFACSYRNDEGEEEHISISGNSISTHEKVLYPSEDINVRSLKSLGYSHFYNFNYPHIKNRVFDERMTEIVMKRKEQFQSQLTDLNLDDEALENRMRYRAKGDFFLSYIDENVISGYFTFLNTFFPKLETVPFTFDRSKKKFYTIRDIWKKDFNYSFYLKKLIDNQKRALLLKEPSYIRKVLKDTPFTYFNLSPAGIIFFTDYNFIYGRKSILIPYTDIEGFIDEKSISNIINS